MQRSEILFEKNSQNSIIERNKEIEEKINEKINEKILNSTKNLISPVESGKNILPKPFDKQARNSNHFNQVIKINKEHSPLPKKSLHTSSISINISERMSKIEEKLNNLNSKVNSSQIFSNSGNMNLDSRVKSYNDMSEFEESKIIKNKSFFSLNN